MLNGFNSESLLIFKKGKKEPRGQTYEDYEGYEDRSLSFKELSREKYLHYPTALPAAQIQLQV